MPTPESNLILIRELQRKLASMVSVVSSSGFTAEQAQDAIGTILADTASIDLRYQDTGSPPAITATLKPRTGAITFTIDGGGSAITPGIKFDLHIPVNCTITEGTLLADQTGDIVIDIWADTYANYPPTDADSITGGSELTITSDEKSQDSTLSGWSLSLSAGDTIRGNVDSCTDITRVQGELKLTVP